MTKIKFPKKSLFMDMTAMVDMAFLLVTFFMLAAKFKPDEPVAVVTPSSTSDVAVADVNAIQIVVDSAGRVFFGVDNQNHRLAILDWVSEKKDLKFTEEERNQFRLLSMFGVPFDNLKQFLSAEASGLKVEQPGIPTDSTKNELGDWVLAARYTNREAMIFVKGDSDAKYPAIDEIMNTMKRQRVHQFNFVTELER